MTLGRRQQLATARCRLHLTYRLVVSVDFDKGIGWIKWIGVDFHEQGTP